MTGREETKLPAIFVSMVVDGSMVGSVKDVMDRSVEVIMNSECARGGRSGDISQDGIRIQGLGHQTAN